MYKRGEGALERVWELPGSGREAARVFLGALALGGPSLLSDGKLKPQCLPEEGSAWHLRVDKVEAARDLRPRWRQDQRRKREVKDGRRGRRRGQGRTKEREKKGA